MRLILQPMLSVNFSPFPIIKTSRLILRELTPDDAPQLFEMRSDREIMKFIPRTIMQDVSEAYEHLEMIKAKIDNNEGINWAISYLHKPEFIGIIGHFKIMPEHYRSEIGYMLSKQHHGKGIMTEAVQAVVNYGFQDLKLHSIEAIIDPDNYASATVLERSNFVREAHLKENQYYDGRFIDTVIYSLLNPAEVKS